MASGSGRMLVVGASGQVGTALATASARAGWNTLGVARSVSGLATEAMDLSDRAAVEAVVQRFAPDVVAIASAWPWVDGCQNDPARSHRENVETVATLLAALEGSDARVVFYSTDHVFDGTQAFNVEADAVHPLSVYAQHKLEAEGLLLASGRALIGRTSYVFGVEARRKNFVYRVLDAARERSVLKVPQGQAGSPTHAGWLADSTLALLHEGTRGVVHLTGPEVLSKAQWARRIAAALKLAPFELVETTWAEAGQVAPRPDRVELRSTRHSLKHPQLDELLPTLSF